MSVDIVRKETWKWTDCWLRRRGTLKNILKFFAPQGIGGEWKLIKSESFIERTRITTWWWWWDLAVLPAFICRAAYKVKFMLKAKQTRLKILVAFSLSIHSLFFSAFSKALKSLFSRSHSLTLNATTTLLKVNNNLFYSKYAK